jgi:hypothetical protein
LALKEGKLEVVAYVHREPQEDSGDGTRSSRYGVATEALDGGGCVRRRSDGAPFEELRCREVGESCFEESFCSAADPLEEPWNGWVARVRIEVARDGADVQA